MSGNPQDVADRVLTAADGDADLARQFVMLFIAELPALVENARHAAGLRDHDGLQRVAHSLRGSAATLGFMEVADAALLLETHARGEKNDAHIAAHVEKLMLACDDANSAGRAYLQRPA